MNNIIYDYYSSPLGDIQIAMDGDKLILLDFADNADRINQILSKNFSVYSLHRSTEPLFIRNRLDRYFEGDWKAFTGLIVDAAGTLFQQTVWNTIIDIAPGKYLHYDQLAIKIGNPNAVRAAANACAKNPVSIVIPCHRVIGKDGSMRGYAGGVDRKKWLLKHEGLSLSL